MRPPGTRLRALAARLLAASTMAYLVDPAIADMQAEYEEASRGGLTWRKRWICIRGHLAFFRMIVAHGRTVNKMSGGLAPLRGLSLDLRLALRLLVEHIGLTVVGTVAMAFAIWSGIVAFEFYTQIMHPRLPLEGGARVVGIVMVDTASRGERVPTLHDFVAWRDAMKSIQDHGPTVRRGVGAGNGGRTRRGDVSASGLAFAVRHGHGEHVRESRSVLDAFQRLSEDPGVRRAADARRRRYRRTSPGGSK